MKVLVTGADGFIGSHLVSKLNENNCNVEKFDIKSNKDVSDYDAVLRAFKRNDYVFHLAAEADVWVTEKDKLFDTNIIGVRNIEKAANKTDTPVMFASSITARNPTNIYSETKLIGERIIKDSKAPISWFRCTNVIGTNTDKGQVASMIEQGISTGKIEVWGNGEIKRTYVSVENLCNILYQHLEDTHENNQRIGFCGEIGSKTMTNLEIAKIIANYIPNVQIKCIPKMPPSPRELIAEDIDGEEIEKSIRKVVKSKQNSIKI